MEGLILLGLMVVALAVFSVLAFRFGADSRIDSIDSRSATHSLTV
jgi:hypothetical protein